jgi:uncharacterized DUF497 family protein
MKRRTGETSANMAASHSSWRLVFEDERCLIGADRVDKTAEQRWHAIGAVRIEPQGRRGAARCARIPEGCHGEEVIRIISARRAEKREIRRYQEQAIH